MIATEDKANTWLGIRDIAVNADEVVTEEDPGTLSVDKLTLKGGSLNNLLDDSNATYAHFAESPYKGGEIKDYLPVDASITLTFKKAKKFILDKMQEQINQQNMSLNIQRMVKHGKY